MMARTAVPAPRRERWERFTTVPLVVLGFVFIVAYSVYVLATGGPGWLVGLSATLLALAFAVFLIDIVVRIALTPRGDRWYFFWTHPIDVLSVVLPVFRAFRVLVLLREVPFLQRRTGAAVRTVIVIYALTYAVMFVYFIALATLSVERYAPGATITSLGEALWWAVVTVATVGYGDAYPITTAGRLYATLLMVGGIAIVGTASATIISLINERIGRARASREGEPPADGTV